MFICLIEVSTKCAPKKSIFDAMFIGKSIVVIIVHYNILFVHVLTTPWHKSSYGQ